MAGSFGRVFAPKMLFGTVLPILVVAVLSRFDAFETWFGLSHAQEVALEILIVTAVLWIGEAIPLFVTSFVVVFLQVTWLLPAIQEMHGPMDAPRKQAFLSPFFSDIILLFLGGFVLSAAMVKYRLDRRMAAWILHRTGSKPSRVLAGIMLVASFLSMWMSNTATAAMMLVILFPIVQRIPESNSFSKALTLAVPFACNLGGIGTPIGTPPNAVAITYLGRAGVQIGFGEWMLATVPFVVIMLVFLWLMLLRLHPPGDLRLEVEIDTGKQADQRHWWIGVIFVGTCVGWFTTGLHGLSTGTVSLIPIIVLFGFGFLERADFRNLSWDILFMLGGGLSLGVGLQESGLATAIVQAIPANPIVTFVVFASLALLMTTFMSNTATANLLIPIIISLGGEHQELVLAVALMCSSAMALPISTPPNAIAFSSGILHVRDMIVPGLILSAVGLLLVLLVGPLYWGLLGFSF